MSHIGSTTVRKTTELVSDARQKTGRNSEGKGRKERGKKEGGKEGGSEGINGKNESINQSIS